MIAGYIIKTEADSFSQCLGVEFRGMSRTRSEYLGIITTYMTLKRQQWMKLPKDEDTKKDIATN